MLVLIDTHTFLWWCEDAGDLSRRARKTVAQEECLVSLVSLWEMSVKISLGKLSLPVKFDRYIPEQLLLNGFAQIEIAFRHVARCATLPWHHRDPFDRMLIAQALERNLPIVSKDSVFDRYGVQRIW